MLAAEEARRHAALHGGGAGVALPVRKSCAAIAEIRKRELSDRRAAFVRAVLPRGAEAGAVLARGMLGAAACER